MTTYTTIADANLDPDSPARSIDALALRDNAIAIAEMDTSAPSPLTLAGAVEVWRYDTPGTSTVTSYEGAYETKSPTSTGATIFATGVVTVEFDHIHTTASGTAYARVVKNGSLVQEWTITGNLGTLFPRSVDVSVSFGDVVLMQVRVDTAGQGSAIQSRLLKSDREILFNSPEA